MSDYILSLVLAIPETTTEIAFMIDMKLCVICHAVDDGFDYTIVNIGRKGTSIVDDGVYDNPNIPIGQALKDILDGVTCVTGDESELIPLHYDSASIIVDAIKSRRNDMLAINHVSPDTKMPEIVQ